mgnify:CR=1 FL=1
MEAKKSKTKIVAAAVILVVLVAAVAILYGVFRPKPVKGSKEITVTVVDKDGNEKKYEHRTDAEYLRQALEEIEGLTVEGEEGDYGLFVKKVNGMKADYDEDGAYWSFYLNDVYCNSSIDGQPVNDGDAFAIKYETGM